jgi:translation elongation factor EF-Ts
LTEKAKLIATKKGKQTDIWKVIFKNYLEKWKSENFLLEQKYIGDEKITVREFLNDGEEVKRFLVVAVK